MNLPTEADSGRSTARSTTLSGRAGLDDPAVGRRHLIVLGFSLWTLFVWGGRLRNLWLDPGGFGSASRWSLLGSVAFTIGGLAVLGVWLSSRFGSMNKPGSVAAERVTVAALAAFTTVVWLIRGIDIALEDHEAAFIAVHVMLALVSIGLAALALRQVFGRHGDPGTVAVTEPGRSSVG